MPDLDQARALLTLSENDARALGGMADRSVFTDEIFGFHAQQAMEKALKAWLCVLGRQYARTHDLTALLAELEAGGADVEAYWPLAEYNVYAVQLRYQTLPPGDEPLDRPMTVERVRGLVGAVRVAMASASGG